MTMNQPIPGWYPDPDGSGGQRYWDGQRWTAQRRPPDVASGMPPNAPWGTPPGAYAHRPPNAAQRVWRGWSNNTRIGVVVVSVLALVAMLVGITATMGSSSDRASGRLPADPAVWQALICAPDSFVTAQVWPGSMDGGYCPAKDSPNIKIFEAQFNNNDPVNSANERTNLLLSPVVKYFVEGVVEPTLLAPSDPWFGGAPILFVKQGDGAVLKPLRKYGLDVDAGNGAQYYGN